MSSLTSFLGAPDITKITDGRYNLHRYFRCDAAVAAPITPVNIQQAQEITVGAVSYDESAKVFQIGGGAEYMTDKKFPTWDGNIKMLGGYVGTFQAALLGQTWDKTSYAAISTGYNDYPLAHIEAQCADEDGTLLHSMIYMNVFWKDWAAQATLGRDDITMPIGGKYIPFMISPDVQMVVDKYTTDASEVNFTLSSTPIKILEVASARLRHSIFLEKIIQARLKLSSQVFGTLYTSGVEVTGDVVTFTTAPAAGTLEICYLAAR